MSSHIEINGKRYDADTGKPVGEPTTMKPNHHLDGIVAPTHVRHQPTKAGTPAHHIKTESHHTTAATPGHPHHPSMQDVKRPVTRRPAHTPQPTRTLMRHVVTKPQSETTHHPHLKAQAQANQLAKAPTAEIMPKFPVAAIDNQRLKHAKVIPKSKLISHYNPASGGVVPVVSTTPAPQLPAAVSQPVTPLASRTSPVVQRPAKTTAELLQRAINQANSHQQPAPRGVRRSFHRGRRIAGVSTFAVVSLVLFGFVLHQNMPNIRLDLASSRAGFAASLPASSPAGFSLSNLNAATGQVALHFRSNTNDSRAYTLTERPSNWDSATLRDSFVVTASDNKYETVVAGGRTLYLYGQQNVTWVNGGIWYLVTSNGALSNQQLIDIATSL